MPGQLRVLLGAVLLALAAAGCDGSSGSERGSHQPGDLALDYLSGERFTSLRVEVDYIDGSAPSPGALDQAREIFERRLEKPAGVRIEIDSVIPAAQVRSRWEIEDIFALEEKYRRHHTGDAENPQTAVIWMVYLDGASAFDEDETRALGLACGGSDIAIFRRNIDDTTFAATRDIVEAMVIVHEAGHLFGLVNNGIPMVNDHEDRNHERHDVNESCVMYHKIETSDVERLLEDPPIDFDFQCQLDMYMAGGLAPDDAPAEPPAPLPFVTPGIGASGGGRGPIPDLATIPLELR